MSVQVVPWSPEWAHAFTREADVLRALLAPWSDGTVEHIGSTAVPGLAAKPVLDVLVAVEDLQAARAAVPVLEERGYRHAEHRPHEALWFYRQDGEDYATRTVQVHLTRPDSALWRERLAFRDALRADDALRDEYAALKLALAEGADLAAYTAGKRDLVARVLQTRGIGLAPRPA